MNARVRLGALALIATAATAAPVSAATYGSRTMREGTSGRDVKQLQRYLTTVGFETTADGAFGPRTARSVRRFERSDGRPVNGVVPPKDARAIERAATKAEPEQTEPVEETAPTETSTAYITREGLAVAPADAPEAVKQVIAAGNEIAKKPYEYGGGHGDWNDSGYDCSGSVSYALHGAGLVGRPLDSGEFMSWRFAGRGAWITVYAHGGHVYMKVAGLRFDTSGLDEDGTRWHDTRASREGYAVRHPSGL
jgi:peptidoglycan hydrolase-like protein with peptidoglycan-binding domain